MGHWKNQAMAKQDAYEWARSLLCEVGTLKECEGHGDCFDGPNDVQEAYKLVNARVTSGEIKLESGQSRRDLTNLIKAVYDDNSALSKCPSCEKNFRPD